jgi:hypothetical protein
LGTFITFRDPQQIVSHWEADWCLNEHNHGADRGHHTVCCVGNMMTVNFISVRLISVFVIGLYDDGRLTTFTTLESSADGVSWREMLPVNTTCRGNFAVHLETPRAVRFIRMSGHNSYDGKRNLGNLVDVGIALVRFQAFGNVVIDLEEAIAAPVSTSANSSSCESK